MATLSPSLMKLQAKADTILKQIAEAKARERNGVINRILEAIGAYGIMKHELFIGSTGRPRQPGEQRGEPQPGLYRSATGQTWDGVSSAPSWVSNARHNQGLSKFLVQPNGKTAYEEDRVAQGRPPTRTPKGAAKPHRAKPVKTRVSKKANGAARKVRVLFRDPATGAEWTGRGTNPAWMKQYLAEGKTKEDFRVQM